jgi:hypothetical protein
MDLEGNGHRLEKVLLLQLFRGTEENYEKSQSESDKIYHQSMNRTSYMRRNQLQREILWNTGIANIAKQ